MKTTITVRSAVAWTASRIMRKFSRPCSSARTKAPTTPSAPASVGVARPMKIVPSTRKISAIEGTMPISTFRTRAAFSSPRISGGRGGMSWGRISDRTRI